MGETNFQPREIPRSGSKAKDGKERKKEKRRAKVGNNNGQLRIANAVWGGICKPPGPTSLSVLAVSLCRKARGSEEKKKKKEDKKRFFNLLCGQTQYLVYFHAGLLTSLI